MHEQQYSSTHFQDQYQLEEDCCLIGVGSYGHVKRAIRRVDGLKIAVKEVQKGNLTLDPTENGLPLEAQILSFLLHHHATPELFDCIETPSSFYLAMELLPGQTLCDFVESCGPLEEHTVVKIFRQLVKAVKDLQTSGVQHGDINENNIIINVSSDGNLKVYLIDFGASTWFSSHRRYTKFHGGLISAPPEWFMYQCIYGEPLSVWSLGTVLYFLLFGQHPFESVNEILQCSLIWPSHVCFSLLAKDMIVRCLDRDQMSRPTLVELLSHNWMSLNEVDIMTPATALH